MGQPSRLLPSLPSAQIKCGLLKSFGFGQVGGEVLVVHPAQGFPDGFHCLRSTVNRAFALIAMFSACCPRWD